MTYRTRARLLVILCLLVPTAAVSAGQASVRMLYTRTLTSERVLRDGARPPTLQQLRAAIDAYETIVRRYPGSGYSDNALWQAASLAILAYERFGRAADKRTAVRVLEQLRTEYPSSSLVSRVDEALQQAEALQAPAPARAVTRFGPVIPPPSPAVPTAAPATSGTIAIRNILRTPLPNGIRVSIEMDDEASFHAERLAQPSRVFFDLKGARPVAELLDATLRFPDAIVREIRLGRHPQNTTRVVMDMEGAESYSVFTLYHPFRLVIDFKTAAPPPVVATREGLPPLLLPPPRPLPPARSVVPAAKLLA